MELAADRKALYVKRPSKKGTFIRVLVATVIASRSSGPISYTGLVSQKRSASGSFAPVQALTGEVSGKSTPRFFNISM